MKVSPVQPAFRGPTDCIASLTIIALPLEEAAPGSQFDICFPGGYD